MGKSSRPKSLNKAQECVKCHTRTFPLTSNMKCRDCDSGRFFIEYQKGKEKI